LIATEQPAVVAATVQAIRELLEFDA